MRGRIRQLLAVIAGTLLVAGLTGVAAASASEESQFVSLINQSRQSAGLPPLSVHGDLVGYARWHTDRMISWGEIRHSASSELSSATSGWSVLGENVGMGPSPSILHSAFMDSPSHRENILGDFDRVGVGAKRAEDGTLFVTVIFMQTAGSSTTTTTTTAPTTTTSTTTTTTAPTTTTTTAPPSTTTTTAPPRAEASAPSSSAAEEPPSATATAGPSLEERLVAAAPRTLGLLTYFGDLEHRGICITHRADGPICIE